ncbi:hypothetical protein [Actibacterium sp. 188UL27-1]|uniref:hypothetical protein n=1 Tax=Actibacterium sp. 188UL27-1 TaxID=2786961 RepID=UPI00195EE355|nr:hypothetical protein [Actibacterium sp. 188UL27-1]MBM7067012.1 hypothetical protein [Actibacterium sp. 188UL27-1]
MDDFDLAHDEVVRLHVFLGAWFRGELAQEALDRDFADVLHTEFENVQPAGVVLTRADIVTGITAGRGTNPGFQITIEAPRLLGSWPGFILFQYIEHQTGALASAPENRRLSTVLFERDGEQLIWRYLTEVGREIG